MRIALASARMRHAAWLTGLLLLAVQVPSSAQKTKSAPKNIIVMISDGWGRNTITATTCFTGARSVYEGSGWLRAYMSTYPGSTSSKPGAPTDEQKGSYDPAKFWTSFDYPKSKPTDSAAAATTMATGVKTYNNAIGMDVMGNPVENATEAAKRAGKSAGVITTVPISHATPAGFVAHNLTRGDYEGIANEMLTKSRLDVIMGAGHPEYDNNHQPAKKATSAVGGDATWAALKAGKLTGADADGDGKADPWTFVESKSDFLALRYWSNPKRVCGVLQVNTTSQQSRDAGRPKNDVPTLADLALGAINVLDDNPKGFFLMIEGGAVDWAGHGNQKDRIIEEQQDFNEAVEAVSKWVRANSSWSDTLVVVTGDHETGYLWGPGSGTVDGKPVWNEIRDCGG
ncbi:MAG: alkaline phosphatase, partial [Armatimonadetes bacterium]|nr:alkaline phosphatase [Armatimonadota bacterium]